MTITRAEYERWHRDVLVPVAARLEALIADHVRELTHIDRVSARAKAPDRFMEKAAKRDEDGQVKYRHPRTEIQDILGARVTVFYARDVDVVSDVLKKYFRAIEEQQIVPDHQWKFGYFGRHFISAVPTDAIPRGIAVEAAPTFFELQVKTLFQHAWAEAGHDIAYKPQGRLSDDQQRRLAYTAAQAWGADRMFDELVGELVGSGSIEAKGE